MTNVVKMKNARSVKEWSELIAVAWQKSTASVIETGRMLIEAKDELGHGKWLGMVQLHLPFDRTVAFRLMAIADNPILSNVAHGQHLPPSWRTLYELTKLPEPELKAKIKDGTINPKMERKDIAALRGIEPKERKKKENYPIKLTDWRVDMHDRLMHAAFTLSADDRHDLFATIKHMVESLNRDFDQQEAEDAIRKS